jgi:hypothetical protein
MSLSSRHQILLHAKMNFQRLSLEPTPAAYGEMCRLGDLGNSEHALVKCSGFIFASGRHRELDVIYLMDLHFLHPRLDRLRSLTIHLVPGNFASSLVMMAGQTHLGSPSFAHRLMLTGLSAQIGLASAALRPTRANGEVL